MTLITNVVLATMGHLGNWHVASCYKLDIELDGDTLSFWATHTSRAGRASDRRCFTSPRRGQRVTMVALPFALTAALINRLSSKNRALEPLPRVTCFAGFVGLPLRHRSTSE
jgi:hypothetical protein